MKISIAQVHQDNRRHMTGAHPMVAGRELRKDWLFELNGLVQPLDAPVHIPLGSSRPKPYWVYSE